MSEMSPKEFKHILVGVDDSEDAQLAFRYAINRAKTDHAKLTIVSILEQDNMNVYEAMSKDFIHGQRADLEEHVQKYAKLAKQFGVTDVTTVVDEGDPGEMIVKDIIPAIKPDLLVIGSISKRGVRKYFGSQAAYMAKHSPISVLVIR
ncbi:universal stress protein [Lactiplantibacillus mudanjiangensis]|uniref:Universal stress protein n=1 Tax=Lactiplantibacillus mudanjiangensis TaxID=1296538 RepID=A0A660E363_9LACO|nr:universal stress protein [Lactiplantibacillus mudanjiangensis]VDG26223.1 universal stress protein UspA [Lactobacillus sp.] [Lactiplantibacillus mudanjiangensis]VDG27381.1 universal stress protein UspA [Lactobacillus sp.] [Lactiplantibacillus mudanjiangensis]VDG33462.1 universal stress protein UspA [Lactobacillus sp.] [Lactiplantibacillus mudanjiangensis]